jgi:hypothetical protein
MNRAIKAIAHEIKIRRVAYFYAAAEPRSRGALWPSFAPALIGSDRYVRIFAHSLPDTLAAPKKTKIVKTFGVVFGAPID